MIDSILLRFIKIIIQYVEGVKKSSYIWSGNDLTLECRKKGKNDTVHGRNVDRGMHGIGYREQQYGIGVASDGHRTVIGR